MPPNLVDAVLLIKILDSFLHVAECELPDHLLQPRVFLPHDFFNLYGFHTGVLKLCKRASSLDGLVLSPISNQQDSIIRTQPLDELMQLPSGSEGRLVEHVQPFLTLSACQMFLWSRSLDVAIFWARFIDGLRIIAGPLAGAPHMQCRSVGHSDSHNRALFRQTRGSHA